MVRSTRHSRPSNKSTDWRTSIQSTGSGQFLYQVAFTGSGWFWRVLYQFDTANPPQYKSVVYGILGAEIQLSNYSFSREWTQTLHWLVEFRFYRICALIRRANLEEFNKTLCNKSISCSDFDHSLLNFLLISIILNCLFICLNNSRPCLTK